MGSASLIPRYNWDYGLGAFLGALRGVLAGKIPSTWPPPFGDHALPTSSGRASLVAILQGLDLGPGAGVGVPLFCCPVVFEAIQHAGCRPVFLDVDPDTLTVDPFDLKRKKDQQKAVVVVHIFGHPADMDALRDSGGSLPLIEDCCHSLYSTFRGQMTGTIGDASFFSFRSGKYLSAGEGSLILIKDPQIRSRVKRIIDSWPRRSRTGDLLHISTTLAKSALYRRPWYGTISLPLGRRLEKRVNLTAKEGVALLQMSAGDAAVIRRRLETFPSQIERQRRNALWLKESVGNFGFDYSHEHENVHSNFFQFIIRFPGRAQRDNAINFFTSRGIDVAPYGDGVPLRAKNIYGYSGGCRNAELACETVLSIPHYYRLSMNDLEKVADALNNST